VPGGAAAPTVGLAGKLLATGDLNNDGSLESVALLWSNLGGSGTFDYVAVMGRDASGAPANLGTAALGDRIDIRAARIDGRELIIDVVQPGPEDAACCPGQKATRYYELRDTGLTETRNVEGERVSLADITGTEWVLRRLNTYEDVPDNIEISFKLEAKRISGNSGCNNYSGSVTAGNGSGGITVDGPMISTMMACPPPAGEIEQLFLQRLQAVNRFSFFTGDLALDWQIKKEQEAEVGSLIFEKRTGTKTTK